MRNADKNLRNCLKEAGWGGSDAALVVDDEVIAGEWNQRWARIG